MKIIYKGCFEIAVMLSSKNIPHSNKNAPLQSVLHIRFRCILQLTNITPVHSNTVICNKLHANEFYTRDFISEQIRNDLSGTQASGSLLSLSYLSEMPFLEEFV